MRRLFRRAVRVATIPKKLCVEVADVVRCDICGRSNEVHRVVVCSSWGRRCGKDSDPPFSGFDMYFSGTVLYVVSRYLFLLRVLWATFHEGPMEDKWNMTAAGLSCMVILAHDYKVVERMVHHIRL